MGVGDENLGVGDVDLKVALGLIPPPPGFDFSKFESKFDDDEEGSARVVRPKFVGNWPKSVFNPPSNGEEDIDCHIVGATPSNLFNVGINGPLKNVVNEARVVDLSDNPVVEESEAAEGGVGRSEIPLKEIKREEGGLFENDKKDSQVREIKTEHAVENDEKHCEFPVNEAKKEEPVVDEKDEETELDLGINGRLAAARNCFDLEEKLKIGTEFPDLEQVYLLYCQYGRWKGFSVRKGEQRYFGKTLNVRYKEFNCSSTGFPNYQSYKHKLGMYKKLVVRTNCKARITVSRDDLGSFFVLMFEKEHNHELVDCDQTYLLRSSRQMSYAKKSVMEALHSAGIGVSAAFNFMAKESGGVQNIGFTKRDAYNHMDKVRRETKVEDGDARLLYDYFSEKSSSDPFFFCKYQVDDSGRLMNIFFRDNRCALDYDVFGDVLSVDTTYRTNKYNMICMPFVGINHQTRNVMFGMAMLSDETTTTFKWLFETFLQAMHGKQPKVIFSDQCKAVMNAIDVVFPKSKHRLCQWHIMKNCASNFGKLHGDSSFKSLWYKCMNHVERVEEFNSTWTKMMENYRIPNRGWFDGMHNMRHRWASCFSRGIFTAGLLATSRSESTNKVLKDVVCHTVALIDFVKQYEQILNKWRSTERTDDAFGIWQPGQAITHCGLLKKAAAVFTRTIYKQFEHDLANCITVVVDVKAVVSLPDNNSKYTARCREIADYDRTVVFNSVTHVATCDCGKWETEGLICRHILRINVIENVNDIPDAMIYHRWTKRAKDLNFLLPHNTVEESAMMRHMTIGNEFMRYLSDLVCTGLKVDPEASELFLERMKEVSEEFKKVLWTNAHNGLAAPVKKVPVTVPLFRDPRRLLPRGFANVRKPNPFQSKGVKRRRKSTPKGRSAKKAKVDETSPLKTQEFMPRSNSEKTEGEKEKAGDSNIDEYDNIFFPLSL